MSKVEMMSAKNQKKGALVPRLRFPEFRDAGEWKEKNINNICKLQAGKFVAATDIFESHNAGLYPCYWGNGLRGYTGTYTHSGKYPLIGRQGALCGNIKMTKGQFHATEHALVATPSANVDVDFLFYMLDFLDLNRYATGQAQPGLSVEVLEKISVFIPKDKLEQQRIADCLSSLDGRITAESSKLDTLKEHKKGLLKQLFPGEGETLPQLRFPEFRDAGEWEESSVNDLLTESCQIGSKGNKAKKLTVKLWGKGVFKKVETFQGSVNTQYYRRQSGQFIYSKLDFLNQAFGIIPHHLDGFESTVDLPCFDFRSDVNPIFFLEYVKREAFYKKFGEIADGGRKAKRIQVDVFLSFSVLLPLQTKEQQKIADCLSSLDEIITAQAQKIDLLKTHKKGLMQQLFPVIDEAKA